MYKNILLTVDGSAFGNGTIPYAIALAKATGARITAIHITLPRSEIAIGAIGAFFMSDDYTRVAARHADSILDTVRRAAAEAGVGVKVLLVEHVHPWQAITRAATDEKCDLIVMASHGRRGIAGVLLGSETKKVLTHTTTPVLVWRGA
jgi:nucleotide-binding universal stress UspA family protein